MNKTDSDLIMIQRYFPDGVDVAQANTLEFVETIHDHANPNHWQTESGEIKTPAPRETYISLKELEPETGVFAAMSPVTHRVYVYFGSEYYA